MESVSFSDMLQSFLDHHIKLTSERALLLLSCLCPYDPLDEYAETALHSDDGDQVANALELIETAAPRDLWAQMFPIFAPEMNLEDKVRAGKRLFAELVRHRSV